MLVAKKRFQKYSTHAETAMKSRRPTSKFKESCDSTTAAVIPRNISSSDVTVGSDVAVAIDKKSNVSSNTDKGWKKTIVKNTLIRRPGKFQQQQPAVQYPQRRGGGKNSFLLSSSTSCCSHQQSNIFLEEEGWCDATDDAMDSSLVYSRRSSLYGHKMPPKLFYKSRRQSTGESRGPERTKRPLFKRAQTEKLSSSRFLGERGRKEEQDESCSSSSIRSMKAPSPGRITIHKQHHHQQHSPASLTNYSISCNKNRTSMPISILKRPSWPNKTRNEIDNDPAGTGSDTNRYFEKKDEHPKNVHTRATTQLQNIEGFEESLCERPNQANLLKEVKSEKPQVLKKSTVFKKTRQNSQIHASPQFPNSFKQPSSSQNIDIPPSKVNDFPRGLLEEERRLGIVGRSSASSKLMNRRSALVLEKQKTNQNSAITISQRNAQAKHSHESATSKDSQREECHLNLVRRGAVGRPPMPSQQEKSRSTTSSRGLLHSGADPSASGLHPNSLPCNEKERKEAFVDMKRDDVYGRSASDAMSCYSSSDTSSGSFERIRKKQQLFTKSKSEKICRVKTKLQKLDNLRRSAPGIYSKQKETSQISIVNNDIHGIGSEVKSISSTLASASIATTSPVVDSGFLKPKEMSTSSIYTEKIEELAGRNISDQTRCKEFFVRGGLEKGEDCENALPVCDYDEEAYLEQKPQGKETHSDLTSKFARGIKGPISVSTKLYVEKEDDNVDNYEYEWLKQSRDLDEELLWISKARREDKQNRTKQLYDLYTPYNPFKDKEFMTEYKAETKWVTEQEHIINKECRKPSCISSLQESSTILHKMTLEVLLALDRRAWIIKSCSSIPKEAVEISLPSYQSFPEDILKIVRLLPGNAACCDCGKNEEVDGNELLWASVSYGLILCRRCAFRHISNSNSNDETTMENSTKISEEVKCLQDEKWNIFNILCILEGGNETFMRKLAPERASFRSGLLCGNDATYPVTDDLENFEKWYDSALAALYKKDLSEKVSKTFASLASRY